MTDLVMYPNLLGEIVIRKQMGIDWGDIDYILEQAIFISVLYFCNLVF